MSDSDEGDSPPRWTFSAQIRAPRNIASAIDRHRAQFERLSNQLRDLDQHYDTSFEMNIPLNSESAPPPPDPNGGMPVSNSYDPQVPPPGFGPKAPAIAFVSVLPPTPYEEKKESGESKRTLAYVQAQQKVLKYLETQSPHTLIPRQARRWTQAIDSTGNKTPKAEEALRLCYYMREQGYDVYNKLNNKTINLYVADQDSYVRDARHDHLYWKQNVVTNEVEFMAPSPGDRTARRNAVASVEMHLADTAAGAGNRTNRQRDRIAAAEARIQAQLEREPQDPE